MSKKKTATWNDSLDMLVVAGKQSTVESVATVIEETMGRLSLSLYRVAKDRPFTRDSLVRLVHGEGVRSRGGVQLSTFLQILEALGLDIEIVTRPASGKSESKPRPFDRFGNKARRK